jgi:hypothetical protein
VGESCANAAPVVRSEAARKPEINTLRVICPS